MKKMICLLLTICMMIPISVLSPSAAETLLGDSDGDGAVTIMDATVIQRVLVQLPVSSFNEKAADVSADGLDIIDATLIQRFLAEMKVPYEINKPIQDEQPESPSDSIVIYFSRAGENYSVGVIEKGNTKIIAEMIAEQTGADCFKLETVVPYSDIYSEVVSAAQQEQQDNARPELVEIPDVSHYKNIYLGYPIWWGDMPMALYTFLESVDLSGKNVMPFCTHAGSGLADTVSSIKSKQPNANVSEGLAIAGTTAQNSREAAEQAVENWLETVQPKETGFDFDTRTVKLNSGYEMPIFGIGTYALSTSQAENSTYWALKAGYRLIDTARIYGNEAGVGRGIKRAIDEGICKREDIFVTTKMWTSDYGNGSAAIDASLERLGLDYIDLMILHHSQPSNDVQAY